MPAELLEQVRLSQLPPPAIARQIRLTAGVSRQRFAEELQIHPVTLTRWEHGTRTPRGELRIRYGQLLVALQSAILR